MVDGVRSQRCARPPRHDHAVGAGLSAPGAHPPDRGCLSAPAARPDRADRVEILPAHRHVEPAADRSASVMPPKPGLPGRCPSTFAKVLRLPLRMRHAEVGRRSTSNDGLRGEAGGTESPLRTSTWRCPFTGRTTVTNSEQQSARSARSIRRLHEAGGSGSRMKLEPERLLELPRRRLRSSRSTWSKARHLHAAA